MVIPYCKPFQVQYFVLVARLAVPLHLQSFLSSLLDPIKTVGDNWYGILGPDAISATEPTLIKHERLLKALNPKGRGQETVGRAIGLTNWPCPCFHPLPTALLLFDANASVRPQYPGLLLIALCLLTLLLYSCKTL